MTEAAEERRYHWIVIFKERGKIYTYLNRTIPYMSAVVKKFYDDHDQYPYRMWVIVDGEIQKVEVTP